MILVELADQDRRRDMLAGRATHPLIHLLPKQDRAMLELSHGAGSQRMIARLLGIDPGTVSRRLRRLREAMRHPVVRALAQHGKSLPELHRRLAEDHFVHGRSVRRLSQEHQMSRIEVAAILSFVRGWAKARG